MVVSRDHWYTVTVVCIGVLAVALFAAALFWR
jgi:hypothetical protein